MLNGFGEDTRIDNHFIFVDLILEAVVIRNDQDHAGDIPQQVQSCADQEGDYQSRAAGCAVQGNQAQSSERKTNQNIATAIRVNVINILVLNFCIRCKNFCFHFVLLSPGDPSPGKTSFQSSYTFYYKRYFNIQRNWLSGETSSHLLFFVLPARLSSGIAQRCRQNILQHNSLIGYHNFPCVLDTDSIIRKPICTRLG